MGPKLIQKYPQYEETAAGKKSTRQPQIICHYLP